ncbi:GCN5-related N-acetyltransferase [Pseudodesulfovibrio mercurii]|uniref:GCN5-related N-acetyltransferase n=1 Tax=Pseudodesulfovibrio mercurii TaxID=641491 RepID=F0JG71_9BACT|nr:N-acetyltransferase [Pseudodesulfovibrio mercurii]EGB13819.1 GCN5-related N-acetyltransferase [Pseudodesulfovibrio mercurii]
MLIRLETDNDEAAIRAVEYAAFRNHPQHAPGAEPTEHLIVDALRASGRLSLSLVAEDGGAVVGHVALSPALLGNAPEDAPEVAMKDGNQGWYLLGPVGVTPERQGRGIGSALIREALEVMRDRGARGVVLVGEPGYYARFGFSARPGLTMDGVPGRYVLGLSLDDGEVRGRITADPAFFVTAEA